MYYNLWKEMFLEELNIDLTSPYHLEGSNLTHTLMVYNEVRQSENDFMFYKLTALLHDIGKRKALFLKDNKKITQGHEGISTYMAVDYLKKLVDIIDEEDLINILFLINHHGDLMKYKNSKKYWNLWKYETHKLDWVKTFNKCDVKGRITNNIFNEITPEVKTEIHNKKDTKNKVYFMIGVPNVGKSTFSSKLNLDIVSRDNILLEYGKEKYKIEEYSKIWEALTDEDQKEIDKLLNKKIKDLQDNEKDFVIDMTLLSVKSRKNMLSKIKKDYGVIYVNVLTDFNEIMRRNQKRFEETGKLIPQNVLINMMKNFQMPLLGEDEKVIDIYNILG